MKSIRLLIFLTLSSFSIYAQNSDARLTNLGPQIKAAMIQGSKTYANHLVWAGTTVSGGLGIMPSTQEAKLISWDVEKGLKSDEFLSLFPEQRQLPV